MSRLGRGKTRPAIEIAPAGLNLVSRVSANSASITARSALGDGVCGPATARAAAMASSTLLAMLTTLRESPSIAIARRTERKSACFTVSPRGMFTSRRTGASSLRKTSWMSLRVSVLGTPTSALMNTSTMQLGCCARNDASKLSTSHRLAAIVGCPVQTTTATSPVAV